MGRKKEERKKKNIGYRVASNERRLKRSSCSSRVQLGKLKTLTKLQWMINTIILDFLQTSISLKFFVFCFLEIFTSISRYPFSHSIVMIFSFKILTLSFEAENTASKNILHTFLDFSLPCMDYMETVCLISCVQITY